MNGRDSDRIRGLRAAAAAAAFAALAFAGCATPDIDIGTIDFALLQDGTYEGSHDGGMVKATVKATVAGRAVTSIEILKHDCGTGKAAERIVEDVVRRQSLDVEAVAGATYSSRVILKATENALEKAEPR